MAADAARVLARCDQLAGLSEEPGRLTRRVLTPAMAGAGDLVSSWLREAGLEVGRDALGTVWGRRGGAGPVLVLGSHVDTVRDAGRFDGPLGVLCAIAVAERLADAGTRLPFALEVVAFADEEGLRFGTSYLGSRFYLGELDPADAARTDAAGVALRDALAGWRPSPRRPADILGYVEVHIEQGPVLEREDLPVGIVSHISGQTRLEFEVVGRAGHAGTVPMAGRRDALCGAAEIVLAVERIAAAGDGLVATVGELGVVAAAGNVVPGRVALSVDVRHPDDGVRRDAVAAVRREAAAVGDRRRLGVVAAVAHDTPATPCSGRLADVLAAAVAAEGVRPRRLPSGAGHDAVALAAVAPVAMLFVRCAGGVSHHPDESVAENDVAVAIAVLERAVRRVAADYAARAAS